MSRREYRRSSRNFLGHAGRGNSWQSIATRRQTCRQLGRLPLLPSSMQRARSTSSRPNPPVPDGHLQPVSEPDRRPPARSTRRSTRTAAAKSPPATSNTAPTTSYGTRRPCSVRPRVRPTSSAHDRRQRGALGPDDRDRPTTTGSSSKTPTASSTGRSDLHAARGGRARHRSGDRTSTEASARRSTRPSSATANGTHYHFEWGRTDAYGDRDTAGDRRRLARGPARSEPLSADLTGLDPYSTYHYRVVATNGAGHELRRGSDVHDDPRAALGHGAEVASRSTPTGRSCTAR